MRAAGIDYSSHAVDIVTIPLDTGQPVWHRFPLTGIDAFDRARSVADSVPGRSSVLWDDIVAVGVEHPAGKFGVGPLLRIQGAILARIPARMLVEPFPPAKWRKAVGLPGNCTKAQIAHASGALMLGLKHWQEVNPRVVSGPRVSSSGMEWTQDAHDAHLIALATRAAITTEKAAA